MDTGRWLRRLGVTLAVLGMCCGAGARDAPVPKGKVLQIDGPGVLDQPGATYVLTKDVTTARTAFMVKGDDITLDLGGHTVVYGTDIGVDYCVGVFLRPTGRQEAFMGVPPEGFGGGNRFTLKNGRIVQGKQPVAPDGAITYRGGRIVNEAGDHPRPGRFCHAVYARACDGITIEGVTTEVNSRDSNNIQLVYCSRGEIANNHCISTVREITDRHYPGTSVINVGNGGPMDIHHNTIDGGGQWGIKVAGGSSPTGPLMAVHHNVVRHRSYTTNGYAIGCHAPNMRVYANVVKSIGRGIHMTRNNIDLFNNIVMPREKPNPEYPRTRTHGIKLEGPTHSQIHHNFCRVVAEEGYGDADALDIDARQYSANMIYANTFEAIRTAPDLSAYCVNVIRAVNPNYTVVRDNVFRGNQYHVQFDWGGSSGILFDSNRFEVVGEAKDYTFFSIRLSSVAKVTDMVFRDNALMDPADYKKARQLYVRRYTRANLDLAIEWAVHVEVRDPAGLGQSRVTIVATNAAGKRVAETLTDGEGRASLVLPGFHLIGNEGRDPILKRGPYELAFLRGGREVKREKLDNTNTSTLAVTIVDPNRKLYVYAGEDQRLTTGDVVNLTGAVVVEGGEEAKPQIIWKVLKEVGDPKVADPGAPVTTLTFENPGESWLQDASLELEARLGDEVVRDRVTVRQNATISPTAVARVPRTAKVNTIVQLDASGSRDPRGFAASSHRYTWQQTGGPIVPLTSTRLIDPIFYPEQPGTYTFEVTMSTPIATSEPASVAVVVTE